MEREEERLMKAGMAWMCLRGSTIGLIALWPLQTNKTLQTLLNQGQNEISMLYRLWREAFLPEVYVAGPVANIKIYLFVHLPFLKNKEWCKWLNLH